MNNHLVRMTAFLAVVMALLPEKADSAGVYENAATESAFLLAPPRVVLRASLETGADGHGTDATAYRVYAAFPVRRAFLVAFDLPLVAVSDSSNIDSAIGDLALRARARVWTGDGRSVSFLGLLGTGTGEVRLFPYSSQTIDIGLSVGYVDSLASSLHVWAIAGQTWVSREVAQQPPDTRHDDQVRATVGVSVLFADALEARAGATAIRVPETDASRDLIFAALGAAWTESLSLFLEGQVETGPTSQRVSDWALTAGLSVRF